MTGETKRFVASSPRGFGDILARELTALGAADVRERALGVEFTGTLEVAYRICVESRVESGEEIGTHTRFLLAPVASAG